MQGPSLGYVPVVPNASLVTGTVEGIAQPQPFALPVLELAVQRAEDIEDLANFVAEEVGKTIPIYLRGEAPEEWPMLRSKVRLRVEFRGDESGGGYYAHVEDLEEVDDEDDEDYLYDEDI